MNIDKRLLTAGMYRNYDVAEWNEKKAILTTIEAQTVLADLKEGKNTPLVELIKLPFPRFAEEYFRPYFDQMGKYKTFYLDPAFGFKLYFLSESHLRIFATIIREPNLTNRQIANVLKTPKNVSHRISGIQQIVDTPLDRIPKIVSSFKERTVFQKRFLYLTQYIDMETAKRLNLPISAIFEADGATKGYDLEGKLNILNQAMRLIVTLYLGLYGEESMSAYQIRREIFNNEFDNRIYNAAIQFILENFDKPLGQFAATIGYMESIDPLTGIKEYSSKTYREIDIKMQTMFVFEHLSQIDKMTLRTYSNKERLLYLTSQYMFRTPEFLARNMSLTPETAKILIDEKKI